PSGESVWFSHRKSASGGELDVDMNAAYGGRFLDLEDQGGDKNEAYKALYDSVRQPVIQEGVKYYEKRTSSSPCENIYWPKGNIPSGKYKIYVSFFNDYKYDPKCGGHTVEDCPDAVEYSVRLRIGNEYRDFTGVVEWDEKREKVLIYEFYYFAPGINTKPVVNEAEKLDYFIKNAAHKELAYIALQRKIKPFVAARNWKKAEEILTISREYFKTSKERYDKISQLLAIVKTGKEGAKPENLGTAINTKAEEYAPVISANNRLLFFCGRDRTDNLGKEDIFSSIATYSPPTISAAGDTIYDTTGTWSKATIFPYINTKTGNEAPLSVSVDGNTLLLFSGGDIYFVVRTTEGWSEQKKFPNPINTEYWEGDAMLTADGKAILFASNRPGGYNLNTEQGFYHGDYTYASDLYVSVKNGDSWGEPINLGPKINTMYCERSPFLHPDMKTLYFSSDGHYGFGQLDVFKTTMNTEGDYTSWTEPQNLGKSVNTGGPDWGYNISTFGIYAYFAAQNKENKDDIYRVLLPEDMRPKAVVAVSGKVTDTDGKPLDAKLLWENLELNQAIGQLSSDPVTGNYFIVLPAGKLYGYYADKSGYYPVSKSIDLRNVNQYREITEDIVLVSLEEMKKLKTAVRINNIFFDLDKWDLRPESYPELDRLVEILKKIIANDPTMKIEIMGHTDNTGSDTHNQTLSENRAKAVYTYILSKGIAEKHLTFNGYGEKKPVSDNNTESGRQKNRRVEFRFTE
ncbi:MAG: OmpA family protein, partial [Bacteroidetes bacterium]|nr:OmpA family protein [Bacteroidota bacterium]